MTDANPVLPGRHVPRDLSGCQLGDYHILHRLGRGGMAEVYLADQQSLGRKVALKVLNERFASDQAYVRRFQNEARSAAALMHANIVQIFEVGCRDGVHFIAQEYVPGKNLRQVIARHGPFEPRLAIRILRQVAAALHKAAQNGIVHRDIKPENILISLNGDVKVADFGLARFTSYEGLNLTQEGVTLGTPLYMSPEQVAGKTVDPRSDLYSLGATAYHMLAGRPPFDGETPLAIAVQHLNSDPPRLDQARPDLPPALTRIVHRLLAKKAEDRFQQPAELMRELRALTAPEDGADGRSEADWELPELLELGMPRSEATQRLESVMKTESLRTVSRAARWPWYVAPALALALGVALAWWQRPVSRLSLTAAEPARVARKDNVKDQFFQAMRLGTVEGYESVERNFPVGKDSLNAYYVHRAWQQQAELHLRRDEFGRAYDVYSRLASLRDESDVQFLCSGLLGQANVHALRGEIEAAISKLVEVVPLFNSLQSGTQAQLSSQIVPQLKPRFDQLRADDAGGG